jgi:hypothetical protein
MRKILQITDSLARHGTETFIVNVLKNINRLEIQFDFLLFKPKVVGDYTEIVEQLGAQIYYIPSLTGAKKFVNLPQYEQVLPYRFLTDSRTLQPARRADRQCTAAL